MSEPVSKTLSTRQMRRELVRLFPRCFKPRDQAKVPLKVNILDDILWRCPQLDRTFVTRALGDYCAGSTYQSVIAFGAIRHDLDGAPAGFVTRKQAGRAREKLKQMQAAGGREAITQAPAGARRIEIGERHA